MKLAIVLCALALVVAVVSADEDDGYGDRFDFDSHGDHDGDRYGDGDLDGYRSQWSYRKQKYSSRPHFKRRFPSKRYRYGGYYADDD